MPVVEIDARRGQIAAGRSCILFNTRSTLPFASIEEVGLTETHYSDTAEGGVYYTVEPRAKGRQRLVLPGTRSRDGCAVSEEARTLARIISAPPHDLEPRIGIPYPLPAGWTGIGTS